MHRIMLLFLAARAFRPCGSGAICAPARAFALAANTKTTTVRKGAAGMADCHLSAKIIGRSSGRSATAAAAYRARENEQIMERNALVERPSGII